MAVKHIEPGEVAHLHTFVRESGAASSNALVKTNDFEAILMDLEPGQSVPAHELEGPLLVQILKGAVDFPVNDVPRRLNTGDWMHIEGGVRYGIEAREEARLLLIILFPNNG